MSETRKILVARRGYQRNNKTNFGPHTFRNENSDARQGTKRPLPCTPKKNLANDRLKKLRTSLIEEVRAKTAPRSQANLKFNTRKRVSEQSGVGVTHTKVLKNNEEGRSVLLKSSSINESKFVQNFNTATVTSTSVEAMEWTPAENPTTSKNFESTTSDVERKINSDFIIVVDTNIFLSQIKLIKNIIEMDVQGTKKPIIYIPWMVIEELDFIKEDSNKNSLRCKAQEAIKYIETTLSKRHERMKGQTISQVNEQKDLGKGQDNKIISCCFQVFEKNQNMILLTNDVNLKNKAHINHIPVCSHTEIMTRISMCLCNSSKSKMILDKMTSLCKIVIRECSKKAYGKACDKMPICQQVPHSLQDCLKVFTKYWFPVFQEVLMKQCKKCIDDLSTFLSKNETIKDDSNELADLLRLCVRCCIFLKDVEFCKNTIENTIRELNCIKES